MSSAECKSKSFPNSGAIAQSFKSDSVQAHYVKTSASLSDLGMVIIIRFDSSDNKKCYVDIG